MSENLHDIDDLFKKAIDPHEDMPSLKVWEAIDKNLDKKKVVSISRKYNKLKWAAAVLLLFSFGMAMYTWQTRMRNKELVKENKINKSFRTKRENIKPNDINATPLQTEKTAERKNDVIDQPKEDITKTRGEKIHEQIPVPIVTKQDTYKNRQIVTNANDRRSLVTDQDKKESQKINNSTKPLEKETIIEMENKSVSEKYFSEVPLIFNSRSTIKGIQQIDPSTPFTYQPGNIISDRSTAIQNSNARVPKNKATKPLIDSRFSVTLFYSPEFISTNVKDDHPRYREDDRHQIKNNEKTKSSYSYGALINYSLEKNWALQSGISIFTRVTDINTKTIYARPDNGGNINYRLSCSAGSAYVPLKSGAVPVQGDSTKILSAKNTLQYVSIPIGIKYSIGKGKFKLVPAVRISANILSKGKVETDIATTGGNERSSTNNIEGLKSNYINSQVSLGADWQLGKKISLNFTPTAKLALSPINKDAAVKTKFNSFGLSAGITIRL